jgi:hypothetical protein
MLPVQTDVKLEKTVFWDVAQCRTQGPDDGGSKLLWDIGEYLPN